MSLITEKREEAIRNGSQTFFTGSKCRNGHLSDRYTKNMMCIQCNKEYLSKYQKENMHKWSMYREANRDEIAKKAREYRKTNKEERSKKDVERKRIKRQTDKFAAFVHRVRSSVSSIFRLRGIKKPGRTIKIIGCTFEEFKRHLERQFTKGMTWDVFDEIHIDHIIPLATAKNEEEILLLCHFTNLRPVWASENLSKGAKAMFLI